VRLSRGSARAAGVYCAALRGGWRQPRNRPPGETDARRIDLRLPGVRRCAGALAAHAHPDPDPLRSLRCKPARRGALGGGAPGEPAGGGVAAAQFTDRGVGRYPPRGAVARNRSERRGACGALAGAYASHRRCRRWLVGRLQERMRAIADAVGDARPRPRLACIEWIEPLMPTANWMPELVEMAGAETVAWQTWEDLAAADPDIILVMPCGFDLERAAREMHWLTG